MTRSALVFAVGILIAIALACGGVDTLAPVEGPEMPTVELSEDLLATANELVAEHDGKSFPYQKTKELDARIYTYIASTADKDAVILSALRGMTQSYVVDEKYAKKGKAVVDDDYSGVVHHFMVSTTPAVQGRAIEAAKHAAKMNPDGEIKALLVDYLSSHPKPAGRYQAVESIWYVQDYMADPDVAAAMLGLLDSSEAWLISGTMFRTKFEGRDVVEKQPFFDKYTALLTHEDPGVRGRASDALANIANATRDDGSKAKAIASITPMLTDKHAYPRSAAASALADLGNPASIHDIIPLLDDKEKNTHTIGNFNLLWGEAGRVHHDGSPWSRVDDAALRAVQRLGYRITPKYKMGKIDYKAVDEAMFREVKAAKAWYSKNKGKLPNK